MNLATLLLFIDNLLSVVGWYCTLQLKTMGYKEEDIQAAYYEAKATVGLEDSHVWGFVLGILTRGGAREKSPAPKMPVAQPAVDRGKEYSLFSY